MKTLAIRERRGGSGRGPGKTQGSRRSAGGWLRRTDREAHGRLLQVQPVFYLDEPAGGMLTGSQLTPVCLEPEWRSECTDRRTWRSENGEALPEPGGALRIRLMSRPLPWRGCIRFPADRIHKAVVEALVPGALEPVAAPSEDADQEVASPWLRRYSLQPGRGRDRLEGAIGFRFAPQADVWRLLRQNSALLIKAHYALWARAFAEGEPDPQTSTRLTLSQFCDDLGYARLKNGAHRPECKRQAEKVIDLLMALELEVEYQAPDGRVCRLEGPVWKRCPLSESSRTVAYAPGDWFADPVWRDFNRRVGLVGEGLLRLRPDRDQWAVCVGGYLAALARMNAYRPLTLRVHTLLQKTGLSSAERRNPARMREKLERALDRLEETGVIGQWDWAGGASGEPDMDAPEELERLSSAAGTWAERSLLIRWPAALQAREHALQAAREGHRRTTRRRRSPTDRTR
jgi:hypothetical protein